MADRTFRIVDALDLAPGDLILMPGGIERVATRSEPSAHAGVVIHTDERDVETGWPCPVKVVSG